MPYSPFGLVVAQPTFCSLKQCAVQAKIDEANICGLWPPVCKQNVVRVEVAVYDRVRLAMQGIQCRSKLCAPPAPALTPVTT